MGNFNMVILMGNLTRDPEMRQTQGGMPVCGFGMAINTRKKQRDGSYADGDPTFVDLVAWEHNAESICKFFTKGRSIHITGRLHFSQWQDQQGGKRSKLEVVVDRWEFPDKKADAPAAGGAGYQPQQQPAAQQAAAAQPPAGYQQPQQQTAAQPQQQQQPAPQQAFPGAQQQAPPPEGVIPF